VLVNLAVFEAARIERTARNLVAGGNEYGKYTQYGWHIDHVQPSAPGGTDHHRNKRPRHWRGNCGDGPLINALANALLRK
jgi:hypothetical protein